VVRYIAARSLRTLPGFADFEYDFLAGEAALRERAGAVSGLWAASRKGLPGVENSGIRVDERGQVLHPSLAELLGRRDNRSVTIKE
jgi:hypothetical protein